jgi:hypothetical protein
VRRVECCWLALNGGLTPDNQPLQSGRLAEGRTVSGSRSLAHACTGLERNLAHIGRANKQNPTVTRNAFPPIGSYNMPEARVSSAVAKPTHNVP